MFEISFDEAAEDNKNISNKEYHARPEISKSDLDLLARSPLHL